MMDIRMILISAIRAKLATGETQLSLAAQAKMTHGRFSYFVNGKCDLQISTASRLAAVVGVTIDGPGGATKTTKRRGRAAVPA